MHTSGFQFAYDRRMITTVSDQDITKVIGLGQRVRICVGRPAEGIDPGAIGVVRALTHPSRVRPGEGMISVQLEALSGKVCRVDFDEVDTLPSASPQRAKQKQARELIRS